MSQFTRMPLGSLDTNAQFEFRGSNLKNGNNFFKDTLTRCGFIILESDDGTNSIQSLEPYRSVKQLETTLKVQHCRLQEFLDQMELFFHSSSNIMVVLSSINNDDDQQQNCFVGQSTTFLKLLLRVESIQSSLMRILVNKLLEFAAALRPMHRDELGIYSNVAIRLLNHIRWCDLVYNTTELVEMLLEAIQALPKPLQIEVIASIPGLVSDCDQELAVSKLLQLSDSYEELLPSILDCIENLGLAPDSQALHHVISHTTLLMSSAPPALLPPVTKFLLETVGNHNVDMVLTELRVKLNDFQQSVTLAVSNSDRGQFSVNGLIDRETVREMTRQREALQSSQTLLVSVLKTAFQGKAILSTNFLQMLDSSPLLTVIDVWLLFILSGDARVKSKASLLLARKWSENSFGKDGEVLSHAINHKNASLECLFSSVLLLAQYSVSCSKIGPIAGQSRSFGQRLYHELYFEFRGAQHRQDIVANLVAHVTSPSVAEADAGLAVLDGIAAKEAIENPLISATASSIFASQGGYRHSRSSVVTLRTYSTFLKALLEDLTSLTEAQQRALFRLVFQTTMTIAPDSGTVVPPDDVMILLKKFASSMQPKLRKIAIVGQVAYLAEAGAITSPETVEEDTNVEERPVQLTGAAVMLDTLLRTVVEDDACALRSFLLDELSVVVQQGKIRQHSLLKLLAKSIEDELYTFLGPDGVDDAAINVSSSDSLQIPTENMYNLNGNMFDVFIKIFSTINQKRGASAKLDIRTLSPAFALMSCCVKAMENGSLSSVIVLLGAPLEMPSQNALDRFNAGFSLGNRTKAKNVICATLHYAIDWLREVLNAFCVPSTWQADEWDSPTQSTLTPRHQLLKRFHTLVELEEQLYSLTQNYPEYLEVIAPEFYASKVNKGKGKGGGKKTGNSKGNKNVGSAALGGGTADEVGNVLDLSLEEIVAVYKNVLRPLQPQVCQLLGLGLLQIPGKTDSHTQAVTGMGALAHTAALRLLEHAADFAKSLQLKTGGILGAAVISSSNSRSDKIPSPLYAFVSQLQSVGVFRALYFLMIRANRALGSTPNSQHIDVNTIEASELFIDRPELHGLLTTVEDTFVEDAYDLLSSLSTTVRFLTTVLSASELENEVIDMQRRFSHSSESESPFEGNENTSTESDVMKRPTTALLMEKVLEDLSGKRTTTSSYDFSGIKSSLSAFFDLCASIVAKLTEPPMLEHAVSVVQLLDHTHCLLASLLVGNDDSDQMDPSINSSRLSTLCDRLLRVQWKDTMNNRRYGSKDVGLLVRMNLKWAPNAVGRCEEVAEGVLLGILQEEDAPTDKPEYPTLTPASFVHFYGPVFEALVDCWYGATGREVDDEELCDSIAEIMLRIIKVLGALISFTKSNAQLDKSAILTSALRGGRRFVEAFLKSYKLLQRMFAASPVGQARVLSMLATLQKSTRQLQVLCAHGKVVRDHGMTQEAPAIKKLLEQFLYRMKSLIQDHNCEGAFWVGNLKHRRLDGSEWHGDEEDEEERTKRNKSSRSKRQSTGKPKEESARRTKKRKKEAENESEESAEASAESEREAIADDDAETETEATGAVADEDEDEDGLGGGEEGVLREGAAITWTDDEEEGVEDVGQQSTKRKSGPSNRISRRVVCDEDDDNDDEEEEEEDCGEPSVGKRTVQAQQSYSQRLTLVTSQGSNGGRTRLRPFQVPVRRDPTRPSRVVAGDSDEENAEGVGDVEEELADED